MISSEREHASAMGGGGGDDGGGTASFSGFMARSMITQQQSTQPQPMTRTNPDDEVVIDTGCSRHVFASDTYFTSEITEDQPPTSIMDWSGRTQMSQGTGSITLATTTPEGGGAWTIENVHYAPGGAINILSPQQLMQDQNIYFMPGKSRGVLGAVDPVSGAFTYKGSATVVDGLYVLDMASPQAAAQERPPYQTYERPPALPPPNETSRRGDADDNPDGGGDCKEDEEYKSDHHDGGGIGRSSAAMVAWVDEASSTEDAMTGLRVSLEVFLLA